MRVELQSVDGKIRSIQSAFETLRSQNDRIIVELETLMKKTDTRMVALENKVHP